MLRKTKRILQMHNANTQCESGWRECLADNHFCYTSGQLQNYTNRQMTIRHPTIFGGLGTIIRNQLHKIFRETLWRTLWGCSTKPPPMMRTLTHCYDLGAYIIILQGMPCEYNFEISRMSEMLLHFPAVWGLPLCENVVPT